MPSTPEQQPDRPSDVPLARRTVLPYQRTLPTSAVTVRSFYDAIEAQLFANELAAHDIDYYLMNENVSGLGIPYSGFSPIELQVRKEDVAAAREILDRLQVNPMEVEPEDQTDPQQPIPDPTGTGVLVMAAAYDNPRELYDAAAFLGAARVECFLPTLVPRGTRPPGEGKRFVLRVREQDLDRARTILSGIAEQTDDEPRCPKCGSYRVQPHSPWPGLINFLLGRSSSPKQMECLRCHYRWPVN